MDWGLGPEMCENPEPRSRARLLKNVPSPRSPESVPVTPLPVISYLNYQNDRKYLVMHDYQPVSVFPYPY